jgi:hypothetical protein
VLFATIQADRADSDFSDPGILMKFFALLAAFCALSQAAFAQASSCQLIAKASERLACYDKAAPPGQAKASTTAAKTAAAKAPADQATAVDMLAVENSKLDARLKTICRGC